MKKRIYFFDSIQDYNRCCGCRACEQVCGKNAITMEENREGFLYPVVNDELCCDCGICTSVCPIVNSDRAKHPPQFVYAAINENADDRKKSSSGGVFSAFAKKILEKGGAVYGAAFNENLYLEHQRITNVVDLPKLMGSKYVQSDLNSSYKSVRDDLRAGSYVLFSGTPCQIAGLKLFLRKDYDKLLTTDIVCHGTPSIKIFKMFVAELEKRSKKKVVDFKFRDKRANGWACSSCSCVMQDKIGKKKEFLYNRIMNAYMDVFLSGNINRESCYKCPFAEKKRAGDFTIADYWGVQKVFPNIDYQDGVSLMTVNSEKGCRFLENEKIKLRLIDTQYELAAAVGGNSQMLHPGERKSLRDRAYLDAFEKPEEFISSCLKDGEIKRKIIFYLKRIVRANDGLYRFLRSVKKIIK